MAEALSYLLLAQSVVISGFAVAVLMIAGKQQRLFVQLWCLASMMIAAGQLLVGLRGQIPAWASFTAANLLLFSAFFMLPPVLARRPADAKLILGRLALVLISISAFEYFREIGDVRHRLAVVYAVYVVSMADLMATSLIQHSVRESRGCLVIAVASGSVLVMSTLRLGVGLVDPVVTEYFAARPIDLVGTAILMLCHLFIQVGYLGSLLEGESKKAEQETDKRIALEDYNARLSAMLAERVELIDVLAHEIRQPLNNASAALESMTQSISPQEPREELAAKLSRAQTVLDGVGLTLTNVLTAATALQEAKPSLHLISPRVSADLARLAFPPAARERIRVTCSTEARLLCDGVLLSLALRNLMDNGLKYAPAGEQLELQITSRGGCIVFTQENAAPDLTQAQVEQLFERGFRAQPSRAKGAGLGLFIVRRAAEVLGGSAQAELREGRIRFTVELKAEA